MKETAEQHISKYTAPALGVCTNLPQKERSDLLKKIDKGESFTRKQIQTFFPKACEMMKAIAKDKNLEDMWHIEISKEYWHAYHNSIAEHPVCQIHPIIYQKQKHLKVPSYLGELQEGSIVTTHLGAIIEIIK